MAVSTVSATRLPATTFAASRRSSMRELVQEPMNTQSRAMSVMAVPGSKPMYSKACSILPRRVRSGSRAGSGTAPDTGATISGEVPQVTWGSISAAFSSTVLSNTASASLVSSRHAAAACSH